MSQNDFTIANQGFPAFRADLNSALQALASNSSGATAPSTTFANMWWYDSANNIMYIRNEDNDAWIKFAELDQTTDTFIVTSSINVDDNVKAQFGDSNDLQIYHNGTNSYIDDTGTGNLLIRGENSVQIRATSTDETMIYAGANGAVELNFNNSQKLSTTLTGIDVTGTVVSDGMSTNTAGTSNFIAGVSAGSLIGSGANYNTFVGDRAGRVCSSGDNNVAIGFEALDSEIGGGSSVAVGYQSLLDQNTSNTNYNTAVGYHAGKSVTSGVENTIIGGLAGDALTDADFNVAIGVESLGTDTQGSKTVAIGVGALNAQNFTSATDTHNVAVGFHAGNDVTTGVENTLIGSLAGDSITSSSSNTLVGQEAGHSITTGDGRNTFIGNGAGSLITSGVKNCIIGRYSGNADNLDIRTSDNRIVLSDGDGKVRLHINNSGYATFSNNRSEGLRLDATSSHIFHTSNSSIVTALESTSSSPFGMFIDFSSAQPDNNTNYFIKCEDSTDSPRFFVYSSGDVVNHDNDYGAISDVKLKEQITNASSQWDDIKALQIRKFKMKEDVSVKGDSDSLWRLGVIAQEVETAGMNGLVRDNPDMIENEDGEIVEGDTTTKSVKYSILYMKAVKALQEAMERIETLEQKVATLEGQ